MAIIVYKAVWGLFEALAGVLVLFSYRFIAAELLEDPQDRFLNWLLEHISYRSSLKLGVLFIVLGGIKLALAAGLFYHARLTRKIAIAFFIGVAIFGIYHISVRFSWFEAMVLTVDVIILYYFWLILPLHCRDKGMS